MKLVCAPDNWGCQLVEFPRWVFHEHGIVILAAIILAAFFSWVLGR